MSERFELMSNWLDRILPSPPARITPASADASFRHYFRAYTEQGSYIIMDAPPDKEDCLPFIRIAEAMYKLGLQVPRVLQTDLNLGFLLLSDLGSQLYLASLDEASVQNLYQDALNALLRLQIGGAPDTQLLPRYDRALLHQEMELFRDWFLGHHLQLALDTNEHRILDRTYALLSANALEQPQVWVHRDYHSRNLMVTERDNPGILDFQDAVVGPITYDLVSLLRDCYIAWPRQQVEGWALQHREQLQSHGMTRLEDPDQFLRWFDLMGVQRHLKATGIFARLNHRDGKPGYLGDIPRTLGYVLEVAERYSELAEFLDLLQQRVGSELALA